MSAEATSTAPPGSGPRARPRRVARPPGPNPARFATSMVSGRVLPTEAFTSIARRYPRIAHIRLPSEHLYVLSHPDLVRTTFVTHGRWTIKGRGLQQTRPLLGDGLLTSEGELHRRQRRLVQPAFHQERIRAYAEAMVAATRARELGWTDGDHVDLAEEMSALTLDIVGRTLFGADLSGAAEEVADSLSVLLSGFQRRMYGVAGGTLDRLPTEGNRRRAEALDRLDSIMSGLISGHRAAAAGLGEAGSGDDVLSMLMAARDEVGDGQGMTDRLVRDEVMTLVLAGHETTANALTWAWFLLGRHQDVRQRLHAEVDTLGEDPGMDQLDALPWTRAVVAETLRLYPPAWTIGRRLTADLELDGWILPAGSLVLASQWVLHRDPRWWSDGASFRPQRWLDPSGVFDETAPGQPRGAWFPFGLGSRVCIGESFAWTEAVLVLATLARRWHATILAPRDPPVRPAVTLRPRDGMPAVLHNRLATESAGPNSVRPNSVRPNSVRPNSVRPNSVRPNSAADRMPPSAPAARSHP
jgi:cytochrome P450